VRVVYIADQYEYYGANESLMSMIVAMSESYQVEPVILTSKKGRIWSFACDKGYETYSIGHKPFMIAKGSDLFRNIVKELLLPFYYLRYKICNFVAVIKAEKYVDFSKVDIIHTNLERNDIGEKLARRNGVKHVVHLREFVDKDYPCYKLNRNYIDYMNMGNTLYLAISDAVREEWINKGILQQKIMIVYNGIDLTKFNTDKREKTSDYLKIVMTGAVIPPKGHQLLIDELALIPDELKDEIKIDIYGEGPITYKRKLIRRIRKAGLDGMFRFCGYTENINEKLKNYDIGVTCSEAEAFGRCTVEYMLSGVVPVVANTGANTEIVKNGITGFVFDRAQKGDLSNVIINIINNRYTLSNIANNSSIYAREHFSMNVNSRKLNEIYCSLK
jgi:glycosyltransferase involved in cell wall biosynthesis